MSCNILKRQKHLNFLKKVGFLIRYNDLELYHGRSSFAEDDWCVRTDVDNSHSANANNIMSVPCLCVASYCVAESYACGTSLDGRTGKMKIHEIVAMDDDAMIVNEKFNTSKLSDAEKLKFFQAIQGISSGAIKEYLADDANFLWILDRLRESSPELGLIEESREQALYEMINQEKPELKLENIEHVVGTINTSDFFQCFPAMMVSSYVFDEKEQRQFFAGGGQRFRINQDYVRFLLDRNNIIALNKKNFSGSSDHIVYVFNLSKVQDAEKLQDFQK